MMLEIVLRIVFALAILGAVAGMCVSWQMHPTEGWNHAIAIGLATSALILGAGLLASLAALFYDGGSYD